MKKITKLSLVAASAAASACGKINEPVLSKCLNFTQTEMQRRKFEYKNYSPSIFKKQFKKR